MTRKRGDVLNSGAANAVFALIGVAITATISLVALFIKARIDSRAAETQHRHNMEAKEIEHEYSLKRIDKELEDKRRTAAFEKQTSALAKFLSGTISIHRQISGARRERRQDRDDDKYVMTLRSIAPTETQVAFEEVRLSASDPVVSLASELWKHLRGKSVPRGEHLGQYQWIAWDREYWLTRKALIAEFQRESDQFYGFDRSRTPGKSAELLAEEASPDDES
ncbi:hypothetical protein [Actinomycetospora flava]|uniref:Uncharacterized protein n=1 Tax=Actinomycetospora flava TaxID=3129232 RepID=A0ABU8M7C4_9PSEU